MPPNERVNVRLTPEEAYDLIHKLASDDAFRQQLQDDPYETLARHHVFLPPGMLQGSVVLPTKESLQRAAESFRSGQQTQFIVDAVPDLIIFFFFIL
jgi:putative modified peptide